MCVCLPRAVFAIPKTGFVRGRTSRTAIYVARIFLESLELKKQSRIHLVSATGCAPVLPMHCCSGVRERSKIICDLGLYRARGNNGLFFGCGLFSKLRSSKIFPRVPISLFSVRCEMRSLDCVCECLKKLIHPHALWHRHVARDMCAYLYFLVVCYV